MNLREDMRMRNDDGKNVSIKDAHYDNYSKRRHNFDVKKAIYFTYKGLKGYFQGCNLKNNKYIHPIYKPL